MGSQLESVQFAVECSGSSQSVYGVPTPEQHAFGEVGSVSGPTHVQTPPMHIPEAHSLLAAHAAPLPNFALQVPALQKFEMQSPSPVQPLPFVFAPHVPSTQWPEMHATGPEHAMPSGCFAVHVPAAQ